MKTHYEQRHRTSMGSTFAPIVAGLYVHNLEEKKMLNQCNPFFSHIKTLERYILVIWEGDMTSTESFMRWLNQQKQFLKFTNTISNKSLVFLDLNIFPDERRLKTLLLYIASTPDT